MIVKMKLAETSRGGKEVKRTGIKVKRSKNSEKRMNGNL